MNKYIFKKTRRFAVTAGFLIVAAVLYVIVVTAALLSQNGNSNAARIEAHELQNELELRLRLANGQSTLSLPDSRFAYAVFDLSGNNLGSTIPKYQDAIDVRFLSTMKEYTVPLIAEGTQVGTLVADIHKSLQWKEVSWLCFPLAALCTVVVILLIRHMRFIRSDIIRPLDELHVVVDRMVKGDLSVPVSYDYDGEIGTLCHDFEIMRDELKDAAERERIHKEKERLLFASLSHDLKTPLSSISGYAESIRYGVVKDQAEAERYADIILKKTNELTHSIEDILTHVQTQMHEMSINKEEIYTRPLLEKLFADAAHDAAAKGLTLKISGEIPNLLIEADPMRLSQVIQNIMGNALKYTERGGYITAAVDAGHSGLHFSVEDTGCGIQPEDVPFVFEPFFRGEKSRDPNISGSGLGLSVARYIVEQHGGGIACESISGEGTRILFSIGIYRDYT